MEFRIANTFTDSLARLTGDEQKSVKVTAFELQMNPVNPGMQLHRIDKTKDPNFWSARVSRDIRLIVHKTEANFLLCYVDHHDDAYQWAVRRKIERHPKTGAAQIVEVRETVREVAIPKVVEVEAQVPAPTPQKLPLLADVEEQQLLSFGVPPEWIDDVRQATEDTIFDLAERLPSEAAEALIDLATGAEPRVPVMLAADTDSFTHPDAQRRFRVMANVEELERALDFPWEKWTVFLHPAQRELVERDYDGPARVAGSAGTGKTVVALHRAVHLTRTNPEARVLLTTFSETLANALGNQLKCLIGNEPRLAERLEVWSMTGIGKRLYEARFGQLKLATNDHVRQLLEDQAAAVEGHKFSTRFLWSEWANTVDAWQLETWEAYRDVKRLGRKTRLAQSQRTILWEIFEKIRSALNDEGAVTTAAMFTGLAEKLRETDHPPFDFAVIDEAQDVGVAQLRFLAGLGSNRSNGLFFTGDLGQRIFQEPFSWEALGVDVRGRSTTLKVNYRTSHQIRTQADRLLAPMLADVDGNEEIRRSTISVFNGPSPEVRVSDSADEESRLVANWIKQRLDDGVEPNEVAVFVRSQAQFQRAQDAVALADIRCETLDQKLKVKKGSVSVTTMHLAKGLKFRAVAAMACDADPCLRRGVSDSLLAQQRHDGPFPNRRRLRPVANLLAVICGHVRSSAVARRSCGRTLLPIVGFLGALGTSRASRFPSVLHTRLCPRMCP